MTAMCRMPPTIVALFMIPAAWAQITPYVPAPPPGVVAPAPEEGPSAAARKSWSAPLRGLGTFGIRPNAPPSQDPRDFNGMYFPVNEMRGGAIANYNIDAPGLLTCRPEMQIGAGPYPEQIFQTPRRITFIEEYNHMVRRVDLDSRFPATLEPSAMGTSIGHWEGDTLVVETRAIKAPALENYVRMRMVDHVTERMRKIDDGLTIEDVAVVEGTDLNGKPSTADIRLNVAWIGHGHVFESICEEAAGLFYLGAEGPSP